jgi:hypothetical protein
MPETDDEKFERLTALKADLEGRVLEMEERRRVAEAEARRQKEICRCISLMASPIRLPSC